MADIKSRNVLVLAEKPAEAGEKYNKNGWVLRVVEWEYEKRGKDGGTGKSVKLEKRQTFIKDCETINGKAEGFTVADLDLILSRASEIKAAMMNPDTFKIDDENVPF